MAEIDIESLGAHVESWVQSAPALADLDTVTLDAMSALVEAGMVQFKSEGWDFKLHEKHPDAPRAQFKLMIREADGVDTRPEYYDRFTLPSVLRAGQTGRLKNVKYVLGYPKAGTPIAEAFMHLAYDHLGVELTQLEQEKITHEDGTRELGEITSECEEGAGTHAVDDTAVGGDTKIEGWGRIVEHNLEYAGLSLIVERDPLGTALIRERTKATVDAAMHWITVVKFAAMVRDLSPAAIQQELDYPKRLFEWNAEHGNLDSIPSLGALSLANL